MGENAENMENAENLRYRRNLQELHSPGKPAAAEPQALLKLQF
uniref:Uncharacterized protein n=1 Tax=Anguilla anguilla TaxID=7936 RepID=A0A0E9W861_ANGAN